MLVLITVTAPIVLALGFVGAMARRSTFLVPRIIGQAYTNMVRGVPDIVFFLFVPVALDQLVEYSRHKILCPQVTEPVYRGNDFVVCVPRKMPLSSAPQWVHEGWGFALAVVTFAIVFGAFAAKRSTARCTAVPRGQLETARAFGMTNARPSAASTCRRCGSTPCPACRTCG